MGEVNPAARTRASDLTATYFARKIASMQLMKLGLAYLIAFLPMFGFSADVADHKTDLEGPARLAQAGTDANLTSVNTNRNAVQQAELAHPKVTFSSVLPSVTDSEIKTFDNANWFFINREIAVVHKEGLAQDRHELLLWLTGTGGKSIGPVAFSFLAADLGYHVINLNYVDSIPASICRNDSDQIGRAHV